MTGRLGTVSEAASPVIARRPWAGDPIDIKRMSFRRPEDHHKGTDRSREPQYYTVLRDASSQGLEVW